MSCEGLLSRLDKSFKEVNLQEVKIAVTQDRTGGEASARTQVYLSKTKLRLQVGI